MMLNEIVIAQGKHIEDLDRRLKVLEGCAGSNHGAPPGGISFDWTEGLFEGITNEEVKRWSDTYLALKIDGEGGEIAKAAAWLYANPKQRKKNYRRFLNGWFSRQQERGGSRR